RSVMRGMERRSDWPVKIATKSPPGFRKRNRSIRLRHSSTSRILALRTVRHVITASELLEATLALTAVAVATRVRHLECLCTTPRNAVAWHRFGKADLQENRPFTKAGRANALQGGS